MKANECLFGTVLQIVPHISCRTLKFLFFPLCFFVFWGIVSWWYLPKSYKNRRKKNLKLKKECVGSKNPFEATGEFLLSLEMAVVGEDNTKAWIFKCD